MHFGKQVLEFRAQVDYPMHIHFVEGCQHRGILGHLQQPLGDPCSHSGHGDPLFNTLS